MRFASAFVILAILAVAGAPGDALAGASGRVLVFSKTAGFRHDSIADGVTMLHELAADAALEVEATEDAAAFTADSLSGYDVVVWLSTTGDVLDAAQQDAFQAYIEGGGGWVGIHSAADTEYDWPWFGQLLGGDAWFRSHPAIQEAELVVEDGDHPSTAHLPSRFAFTDEWYNFRVNPRPSVTVLLTIDETTYDPGADAMTDHPIAWSHRVGLGRAWYTALGHRSETYADPAFRAHVLGGVLWAGSRAPRPTPTAPSSCSGDCDGDGIVAIDELVRGVAVALGVQALATCSAADGDGDGMVSIADLVRGVAAALGGC